MLIDETRRYHCLYNFPIKYTYFVLYCSIKIQIENHTVYSTDRWGDTSISSILVLKILTLARRIVQCCVQRTCTYDMFFLLNQSAGK